MHYIIICITVSSANLLFFLYIDKLQLLIPLPSSSVATYRKAANQNHTNTTIFYQ